MSLQEILPQKLTSLSQNAERQGSYDINMDLDEQTVKFSRGS